MHLELGDFTNLRVLNTKSRRVNPEGRLNRCQEETEQVPQERDQAQAEEWDAEAARVKGRAETQVEVE